MRSSLKCNLPCMFDISKAKREPVGKWDSEAQLPRDMSYKRTTKAVLNRARNIRFSIWSAIATLAFAFGWSAHIMLGFYAVVIATGVLVLHTVYRFFAMTYWAREGRNAMAAADSAIKIRADEDEPENEPVVKSAQKNNSEVKIEKPEVAPQPTPVAHL